MSYEYNIHYFYKDILNTIIEELKNSHENDKSQLKYSYLLDELYLENGLDIKTNIGMITNRIMNKILELVDKYYYKIYFEYAKEKLAKALNEIFSIGSYPILWTGYRLNDLTEEFDYAFNQIMEKLGIDMLNINNTCFINGIKDLVYLCSLKFICFKKLRNELDSFLTSNNKESKDKLIQAFYRRNNNKNIGRLCKIISKYLDLLKFLHEKYNISYSDVDVISEQLFVQRRILEILTFRLITKAGFPSILNAKYDEYEIDIITLIDESNNDGSGIRLIEVTTRNDYSRKLNKLQELLNKLKEEGINKIKTIFVTFNDNIDKKMNNNIYIISFYELIKDYPHKLISTLYY